MYSGQVIDPSVESHEIYYWPGPTARTAHDSKARVKYVWGPIRTGKSVWLCWRFYYLACRAARQGLSLRGIILRDTYRNLKDTTLKTWDEWFSPLSRVSESEPRTIKLRVDENPDIEHELLFRHGQTAADAVNFLSSEYGFIGLEEIGPAFFTSSGVTSAGIAEEVFDMAISRLVQKGIDRPELAMTSNPPPIQHWASRRLIDAKPDFLKALNWEHYWFPPEENKQHLREGFYEELLKSLPPWVADRLVRGLRVAIYAGLPIFQKDFSERLHVRDDLKPIPGLPLTLCVDSSGLAPAALFTQVDHKGRWLWLHELQAGFLDGKLVEQIGAKRFAQMCNLIAGEQFPGWKFKTGWGDPFRLEAKSDTDEKSWQQFFRAEGFELSPGVRTITDRIEGIRERLTTLIDGQPGLLINRQGCPLAIEALAGGYRWGLDPVASRITGAEPVKDIFSHTMDAAGHAARKIFPIVQRQIEQPSSSRQRTWVPPSAMSA